MSWLTARILVLSFHLVLPLYFWMAITLLLFYAVLFPYLFAQPYLVPFFQQHFQSSPNLNISFNCCSNYWLYCSLAITHMMPHNNFLYVNSYSNLILNFLKLFEKYFILLACKKHLTNGWLIEVSISWHFKIYLFRIALFATEYGFQHVNDIKMRHDKKAVSTINLWENELSVTLYFCKSEIQRFNFIN